MNKISTKTLSWLSLMIIPSVLMMPYFRHSYFILIPMLMCLVGGISFGIILRRTM